MSKEAGTLGSRICFINETGALMSAAPSGPEVTENAWTFVGTTGPMTADSELCFAGWNSRQAYEFQARMFGAHHWGYSEVDVLVAVSADGNYNALSFYARNRSISAPSLHWKVDPLAQKDWNFTVPSVNESSTATAAGLNFTVTRRADSQDYKEFVVRFTR
mgnify:CR=1 FL=1